LRADRLDYIIHGSGFMRVGGAYFDSLIGVIFCTASWVM